MATVNGITSMIQRSVAQTVWVLGNADTGTNEEFSRFPFHSATISGTFGGATVVLEASDDDVTYKTIVANDPSAASGQSLLTTTVANRWDFNNVPKFIRPRSSGGAGTAVTVTLISRSYGH